MSEIKLSLFGSCVRPLLWKNFLNSLHNSTGKYAYEVVFAGFIDKELWEPIAAEYPEFKYIETNDIKPAQCYEVARRACTGDLVCWTADDCVFCEGFVDKVYDYFQQKKDEWMINDKPETGYFKGVLSCRTNENGNNETMLNHRFFGRNQNTPLMAPIGVMGRKYLEILGGFDRRYICGQYENNCVMQVYADGGEVYLCEDVCVTIDHKNQHGSETNFWSGYNEDREQLENSWVIGGYVPSPEPFFLTPKTPKEWFEFDKDKSKFWYVPLNNTEVTLNRNDKHEPYEDKDILNKSQSRRGQWK